MYGYEPKRTVREGSWRETLIFVQAAFEVVLPLMAIFLAIVVGVILTIALFMASVWLVLIPLALVGGGLGLVQRRDHRVQAEEAARIERIPH